VDDDFKSLPKIEKATREVCLPVMIRDLDINGHVNHVVYAQWALESVPLETWNSHHLVGIELNYKAEVHHGVSVNIQSEELPTVVGQKQYAHQIFRQDTGIEVARARTTWQNK